jgi:hypothetical protein
MTSLPPYSVQTILAITGARIFEQLKLVRIMRTHVIIEQIVKYPSRVLWT